MKTHTTISIATPLYNAAKDVAKNEKRTFSGQIETWIEEKIEALKTSAKKAKEEVAAR